MDLGSRLEPAYPVSDQSGTSVRVTRGGMHGPADLTLVCPHLGAGGTQRVVSTLANAWSRQGRQICVITLFEDEPVYLLDPRVRSIPIHTDFGFRGVGFLTSLVPRLSKAWVEAGRMGLIAVRVASLRRAIRESGAPIVVSFIGSTNLMTILACMGLRKRVVISERNDPARQRLEPPWQKWRPRLYNRADIVTANTLGALDSMQSYVDAQRLCFLPNPLARQPDTDRAPRVETNDPFILIVGRLAPQKAHDVLLNAFAQASDQLDSWRLVVVGRGELELELKSHAESLGIDGRIDWVGHVDDPTPYYRAASVFALPSRFEGMPNALLEAMSHGVPVVVSDGSPGPLELVDHDKNGLVVPVEDVGALAHALVRLAQSSEFRHTLGRAAKKRVAQYDLPRALAIWEQTLGL